MVTNIDNTLEVAEIRRIVQAVGDPEIPILSIEDLGVLRDVYIEKEKITVVITPTYVGCPAMDTIEADIQSALANNGYRDVNVKRVLAPAWTSDWITELGREKLLSIGIAPPNKPSSSKKALLTEGKPAMCPKCHSVETECISEFGATACKALYRCKDCLEPFDYFKCI